MASIKNINTLKEFEDAYNTATELEENTVFYIAEYNKECKQYMNMIAEKLRGRVTCPIYNVTIPKRHPGILIDDFTTLLFKKFNLPNTNRVPCMFIYENGNMEYISYSGIVNCDFNKVFISRIRRM